MKYHEIANIFPLLPDDELAELAADITANGLLDPIFIHEGKILDGRNRHRACEIAGIPPHFKDYTGDQPAAFVISKNIQRRNLNSSQKACIAVEFLPILEAEAKKRQAVKQLIAEVDKGQARDKAAKLTGTNRQYVSDAKQLKEKQPKLYNEVKRGDKTIPQANRIVKERDQEEKRDENAELISNSTRPEEIEGVYQTILIDPPWDWADEGDKDQLGRAKPAYKTLPLEELQRLPVEKLADDNAHLYLWITNRSLPKGFDLLDSWGFRYITCITWVKPSFGMGNYFRGQTEHLLFGVRGSQPIKRKDVGTVFHAPRGDGGHSSKPEEIYDLVESCSHGPYLEMFSRSDRDGWVHWGEASGA